MQRLRTGMAGGRRRTLLIGVAVVAVVLLFFVLPVVGTYNDLVTLRQAVDAQWAQVENQYQRRASLIPNLVATVRGAADFEQQTLLQVTEARAQAARAQQQNAQDLPDNPEAFREFQRTQDQLGVAARALVVAVEAYPQITATANFRDLQHQLEGTENRISTERMRYNTSARDYNTKRSRFPANLAAGMFGFGEKTYFTAEEGAEEEPDVGELLNPSPTASP